jgi:hypothetical protein
VRNIGQLSGNGRIYLIFYYNQIPLGDIRDAVGRMISLFRAAASELH